MSEVLEFLHDVLTNCNMGDIMIVFESYTIRAGGKLLLQVSIGLEDFGYFPEMKGAVALDLCDGTLRDSLPYVDPNGLAQKILTAQSRKELPGALTNESGFIRELAAKKFEQLES